MMIYRIELIGSYNKELIESIKHKQDKEELKELYNELIIFRHCESYNIDRIDYVAAALTDNKINYKVNKIEG